MAGGKLVDVITGEGFALWKKSPNSLPRGRDGYDFVKEECEDTLSCLAEWRELILSTDYPS